MPFPVVDRLLSKLATYGWPKIVTYINILQVLAWAGLTLSIMPEKGHFLYDEAFFYEQAFRAAQLEYFPVHGPMISGTSPQAFTPGGGVFLVYSVPFFFAAHPQYA